MTCLFGCEVPMHRDSFDYYDDLNDEWISTMAVRRMFLLLPFQRLGSKFGVK